MKRFLAVLLSAFYVWASADDTTKICTSDFGSTKAISASDFDSVKFPLSVGDLVAVWGRGYRNEQISGTGMIYWRCIDGRIATVGPVSDLKTTLSDPTTDHGDAQVSFFDADVEWCPFPVRIPVNMDSVKGHDKARCTSPDPYRVEMSFPIPAITQK